MKKSKAEQCIEAFRSTGTKTDMLGSYTGTSKEWESDPHRSDEAKQREELRPIQDVDDL